MRWPTGSGWPQCCRRLWTVAHASGPDGVVHDAGAVLRDLVFTLADSGDDLSAIEALRRPANHPGDVASEWTAWRWVADLAGDELAVARLDVARRAARSGAWRAGALIAVLDPQARPLCIDIDATPVTAHSDKESSAGTTRAAPGSTRCWPAWTAARSWPGCCGRATPAPHRRGSHRRLRVRPGTAAGAA